MLSSLHKSPSRALIASRGNRLLISSVVAIVIATSTLVAYQLDLYSRRRPNGLREYRPEFSLDTPPHYKGPLLDEHKFTTPPRPFSLPEIVQGLWKPLITPITTESFIDYNGEKQTRDKNETIWRAPLGKQLCIVDIDTRHLSEEHQVLDPSRVEWSQLDSVDAGMLNHYLYGM
jgi:hypothetical protein